MTIDDGEEYLPIGWRLFSNQWSINVLSNPLPRGRCKLSISLSKFINRRIVASVT